MFQLYTLLLSALTATAPGVAMAGVGTTAHHEGCPVVGIEAEQLASLNIARAGHSLFVAGGEPVVVGGHTSGFVPTATAEYLSDGQWHLIETVYAHDQGFSLPLLSGKVLIGGGHAEPLGIGQLFSAEMYHPATHTFEGFGCLDRKRCFATAAEVDSGRVVIAGNWYNQDGMELFDGRKEFVSAASVTLGRSCPYVFRTSDGDVMVFGSMDEHGDPFDTICVDRLRGKPFRPPLFDEWRPQRILKEMHCDDARIGAYAYLFPVENPTGQVAIALAKDTVFSLLPTDYPVPMHFDGNPIRWSNCIIVGHDSQRDSLRHDTRKRDPLRAYLAGYCSASRCLCVLVAGLSTTPATLTLLHTGPLRHPFFANPVLTISGDLLFAGGQEMSDDGSIDNFTPHNSVILLPVSDHARNNPSSMSSPTWLWLAVLLLIILLAAVLAYRARKPQDATTSVLPSQEMLGDNSLMTRIIQLMDGQKPYLDSSLKLQDVADLLGTNRTYISDTIKTATGQSFTQFVNTYRVDYAKTLLRNAPDKKISAIATESGFSSEASFFRTFKAVVGTTPSDWRLKKS